jgi:type III pantothenate kinase
MESSMSDWIVDQGNTRLKLGVYSRGELSQTLVNEAALNWMRHNHSDSKNVLLAASGSVSEELKEALATCSGKVIQLEPGMDSGIQLDYDTPETLGWDRIANAAAVTQIDAHAVWAIIDAGTCITCDLVSSGTFFGGSIAPGIDLRLRAMYAGTASLPLVEHWKERLDAWKQNPQSTLAEHVGTGTEGSLIAGAWGGAQSEIAHRIQEFGKRWPELKVMWTGGDAEYLHREDSRFIFADSNLTLNGYHAILQHLV